MKETFRRGRWGWIRSSEGYSVRLLGRTDLQYRDEWGSLAISAEAMSRPWVISAESMSHLWADIVVETATIPEDTRRPKSEVIDRLRRAFAYVGWNFIEGGRERRIGN